MQAALKVGCAGCRDEVIEDLLGELSRSGDLTNAIAALEVVETPSLRAHNALRLLGLKPGAPAAQRERLARLALKASVQVASLEKRVEFLLASADVYAQAGLSLTRDEQKALRKSYEDLPEDAAWQVAVKGGPSRQGPPPIRLVFFDRAGCARCDEVEEQFGQLREMYPTLEIETYNLTGSETATLLNDSICRRLNVPDEQHLVAPALFSLLRGLVGDDLTLTSMAELAEEAQGMPSPARAYAPVDLETGRSRMKERYEKLGLLVVVTAGLLDGINPCAFSVIIFFLSYLAYLGKNRREIAAVGIVFTLAVFMTYFAIGLFLSGLVTAADAWSGNVTRIIYGATALLAFLVAALSFRDALRCRRGEVHDMTLSLPESLRSRIRLTISRRARLGLTIGATLVLGALVAFFEAPCTGQVYFPTIVFALQSLPQYAWGPVGWLLIYNLCFIAPLVAVFVAVMFGLTSERLTALFRRHLAKTKFAMAAFFAFLGVAMAGSVFGLWDWLGAWIGIA
jgi:cytochrome c biogenesis protein CcdA